MNRIISALVLLLLVLIVACTPSEEESQPAESPEGNESNGISASSEEESQPAESPEGNESDSLSASSEEESPEELPGVQIFESSPSDELEIVEVEMTARQWEFIPDTIKVKKGQTVNLRITSVDVAHGIAIPAFEVNEYLKPASEVEVSFVADKFGTFDFVCSLECGRGHNKMRGVVIVE